MNECSRFITETFNLAKDCKDFTKVVKTRMFYSDP